MKAFFLSILFILLSAAAHATSAADLSFMEGRWQGSYNNLTVVSQFIAGNAQVFVGRVMMYDQAGQNQYTELMRAQMVQGRLVLTEYPAGQQGASLVAASVTATSALFVNSQNSFPSKVFYELNGSLLLTHVEGVQSGRPVVIEYQQARISQ